MDILRYILCMYVSMCAKPFHMNLGFKPKSVYLVKEEPSLKVSVFIKISMPIQASGPSEGLNIWGCQS